MSSRILIFIVAVLSAFFVYDPTFSAGVPGGEAIQVVSIGMQNAGTDPIVATQTLGFKVLGLAKIIVSGLALIYLVLIGAYMVAFSENEERVKSQRKQIVYTLVGFLFLNIPGILYQIFFTGAKNGSQIGGEVSGGWSSILGGFFWDETIVDGFVGDLIGFFQVFIFGIAILLFTWGLFLLIVSGGDEEKMKSAKSRLIYGTLGLIFMGFVRFWGMIIALGEFDGGIQSTAGSLLSLALYFAGPIAIFFLMWGGYYYITSGGEEERMKKGKGIILNTFIATLILLAAYSFLTDLVHFTL